MSRKPSMGSSYVTEKRLSQWEELMRKFSEAHKDTCKVASVDIPRVERSTKYFPTGSQYQGTWDVLGMSGFGEYTFPNGVTYEGDFLEGMFHGKGELRYSGGVCIRGKWNKGELTERTLVFNDSVEYSEKNWKYCSKQDRRFAIEYDIELQPAGKSYLTADQPTKEIPYGYYDNGEGFYDPKTGVIYKYDDLSSIHRSPLKAEHTWIIENCRKNPEEPLGARQNLYEEFTEPHLRKREPPPPAAGIKNAMTFFRSQSIFEEDFDFSSEHSLHGFYDPSQVFAKSQQFTFHKPYIFYHGPNDRSMEFEAYSKDANDNAEFRDSSDSEIVGSTMDFGSVSSDPS
nr:uncharacterized protein LOC110372882 isoform X1 [Helicoverpa armigera]